MHDLLQRSSAKRLRSGNINSTYSQIMGDLSGWLCGWHIDFNSIEFNPVQSQISKFNHDSREAVEKLAKLSRQEETLFTRVSIASVVLLTCNYERISFYPLSCLKYSQN